MLLFNHDTDRHILQHYFHMSNEEKEAGAPPAFKRTDSSQWITYLARSKSKQFLLDDGTQCFSALTPNPVVIPAQSKITISLTSDETEEISGFSTTQVK